MIFTSLPFVGGHCFQRRHPRLNVLNIYCLGRVIEDRLCMQARGGIG
jgi:hypothetical protein